MIIKILLYNNIKFFVKIFNTEIITVEFQQKRGKLKSQSDPIFMKAFLPVKSSIKNFSFG